MSTMADFTRPRLVTRSPSPPTLRGLGIKEDTMARLGGDAASWRGASVVSALQFSEPGLELLLERAEELRAAPRAATRGRQAGKVLANVFYEPSTRTSCSFQAAMLRLGGDVFCVAESTSSAKKGETLEDTARSLGCYADVVVLRHPEAGAAARAAAVAARPVLNAGDGVGEHPTQALLDLYTLCRELAPGSTSPRAVLKDKTIALVGDLKHGRTVHSLAKMLAAFDVKLVYVAPPGLEMPDAVDAVVRAGAASSSTATDLTDVVPAADALYVTRVQRERFADPAQYDATKGSYVINTALMQAAKPTCAVLHPLPRVDEISADFDADPRAAYFRQMENGLFARMALLDLVLGE